MLDEARIEAIIRQVMSELRQGERGPHAPLPAVEASRPPAPAPPLRHGGSLFPDVDGAVTAARRAFEQLNTLPLALREHMIAHMRRVARENAQLLALEPSLSVEPMRGNVDTRLRKRGERGLDAVVLSSCDLDLLGLAHEAGRRFEPEELLPAAGQGALALQVRAGEEGRVARSADAETRRRVEAETRCVALVAAATRRGSSGIHRTVAIDTIRGGSPQAFAR